MTIIQISDTQNDLADPAALHDQCRNAERITCADWGRLTTTFSFGPMGLRQHWETEHVA
jgi:hypothetical protein